MQHPYEARIVYGEPDAHAAPIVPEIVMPSTDSYSSKLLLKAASLRRYLEKAFHPAGLIAAEVCG